MSALVWDNIDDRRYETGVDRGVIYLEDSVVAWNGLISVQEKEIKQVVIRGKFDGFMFYNDRIGGTYQANVKAFNYPYEFNEALGMYSARPGFVLTGQTPKRFHMSYRTMTNDTDYKIHLIYNAVATPTKKISSTIADKLVPEQFEWLIDCIPIDYDLFRSASHYIIDSRHVPPFTLGSIEDLLYGTSSEDPKFPTISELLSFYIFIITDHGDGSFTIDGPDEFFTIEEDETFEISHMKAVYLDEDTYEISSGFDEEA